ncbi:unnamed protein product [Alopecurus aequalis]
MKENKGATAAKRHDSGGAGGGEDRKRARKDNVDGDLISKLPDDILGMIILLLPIKDGVRTQAFARRCQDLWRSEPLNLDAFHLCTNEFNRFSIVSKILSDHHCPGRRFNFPHICLHKDSKSFAEDAAQENWSSRRRPSLNGCYYLLTQRRDGEIIRLIRAPKLEILGPLSPWISEIEIASLILQRLIPTSLNNFLCTVKVLALQDPHTDLNVTLFILRCFPCLEKLYVVWVKYLDRKIKSVCHFDPLDTIKCLDTHLKLLVLKNYNGGEKDIGFAKFFVLNAKVLNEIKFQVNEKIDKKWVIDQRKLLRVESKASQDARFVFRSGCCYWNDYSKTDDLSVADPFDHYFVNGYNALSGEAVDD